MDIEFRKKKIKEFNERLNSMSLDEIKEREKLQKEQDEKDFNGLKDALNKGQCYYCGNNISHFSDKKPCFHWLLKPKGFKKKHFPLLYSTYSFHQIEAYLRWIANADAPLHNIIDLVEEGSSKKIIEQTIRYKNIEWSFSCTPNDFSGHGGSYEGEHPHYHFQMKVDGLVVINYNGFHIPFDDYDFFCFDIKNGAFDRLESGHIHGASIHTLFNTLPPDEIVKLLKNSRDGDREDFHMQTLISADPGTTISGDDIADIIEESKATGVPIATLIQKLKNITQTTYISPGPSIPEISQRTPHQKQKEKLPSDPPPLTKNPFPKEGDINNPKIRSLCNNLVPDGAPIYLDIEPVPGAIQNDCYGNVDRHIQKNGGTVQYGWQIWETLPGVMIEGEFHAVWVDGEGKYHDISPKPFSLKRILFLPDTQKKFEGKQIDNVRTSLVADPLVDRYIKSAEEIFTLMNSDKLASKFGEIPLTPEMRNVMQEKQMLEIELLDKYYC